MANSVQSYEHNDSTTEFGLPARITLENRLAMPLATNLRAHSTLNLAEIALLVGGTGLLLFGMTTNKEGYSIVGASFAAMGLLYLISSKLVFGRERG